MTELKVDNITNLAGSGKPNLPVAPTVGSNAAISTLNTHSYTSSGTEPSSPKNGALWWDSANDKVMVYINSEFKEIALNASSSSNNAWSGDRGLFAAGSGPLNTIEYVDISTPGNSTDFGDLSVARHSIGGTSNTTRGVFAGGRVSNADNTMDYITFSTTGNATDFGNLDVTRYALSKGTTSDGTTGIFAGGYTHTGGASFKDTISKITIATTGNASDFGNLTAGRNKPANLGDATRGVIGGGANDINTYHNNMDYITISSAGNGTDFGDLTVSIAQLSGASDATRGVWIGGWGSSFDLGKTISYITIQSAGNATDFGDLVQYQLDGASVMNATVAVAATGYWGPSGSGTNQMDQFTIQTAANATDFGDLGTPRVSATGVSGAPS